jgi:hypothetical protein
MVVLPSNMTFGVMFLGSGDSWVALPGSITWQHYLAALQPVAYAAYHVGDWSHVRDWSYYGHMRLTPRWDHSLRRGPVMHAETSRSGGDQSLRAVHKTSHVRRDRLHTLPRQDQSPR